MEFLAQGERTVEALARAAGMGLSTASAHLQVLKLANVVQTRREGTRIHYRLAGDDVAALYDAMRTVARTRSADVGAPSTPTSNVPGAGEVALVSSGRADPAAGHGDRWTLIDVRPREEFAAGHIPGARSLPFDT